MRRNLKLWLAASAVAVIILAALWPRVPFYAGKSLGFWLDQLPETIVGVDTIQAKSAHETVDYDFAEGVAYRIDTQSDMAGARAAIKALGGRCLPALLQRLRTKDTGWSRWKERMSGWAVQWHLSKRRWELNAQGRRGQAITAIRHLGSDARPILPEVLLLTQDADKGVRAAALEVVRHLSPSDYTRIQAEQSSAKSN